MELSGRPLLLLLLGLQLCRSAVPDDRLISDRFGVYWNSSNPSQFATGFLLHPCSIPDIFSVVFLKYRYRIEQYFSGHFFNIL
ncbi:hypothetical protein KUCAC02_031696 [Chaenocephalus aceratus]|nr:hypothetical protein KUCAC02_031696 [Chaenocephalus aceratus]